MAPTATRKQREIQEREALILDTAREMLLERGYIGLTMDRIASKIEYSKGTVYQHFSSKEDLIVALATQMTVKRSEFFERASTFHGSPRERCLAVGLAANLIPRLFPSWLRAEQIIHASSVAEKAAMERMRALYSTENACFQTLSGIVRDAVSQGHLKLADGVTPSTLVFGFWSMTYGAHFLKSSAFVPLEEKGIVDVPFELNHNYNALLDGFQWKPLAVDHDYHASTERILKEVFAEEAAALGIL